MHKDFNNNKLIWLITTIMMCGIVVIRIVNNGFFHGKDFILYLVLMVLIGGLYYIVANKTNDK
ncbi:MAG: hypothetical protein IT275_01380 [Chitinophagales bacterium]|nr:hypothetical protein [Chitinophagales bacterium]